LSNQGKVWHFAYGSNLNVVQMKSRIGQWQLSKRALIRNYRLIFNVYSKQRGYVANLQETGNFEDMVSGVVYHITLDQLSKLQKAEGVAPTDIGVELEDGNEISHAKVFIWKTAEKEREPHRDYRRVIEQGFLQHGYPESAAKKIFDRFDIPKVKS
jgi:hypothetical protein